MVPVGDIERLRQQGRELAQLPAHRWERPEPVRHAVDGLARHVRLGALRRVSEQARQLSRAVAGKHEDRAELRARGLQQPQAVLLRRRHRELVRQDGSFLPRLRFHPADERPPPPRDARFHEYLLVDVQHRLRVALDDALGGPPLELSRDRTVAVGPRLRELQSHRVVRRKLCKPLPFPLADHVERRRQQPVERPRLLRVPQPADGHQSRHRPTSLRAAIVATPPPCRIGLPP